MLIVCFRSENQFRIHSLACLLRCRCHTIHQRSCDKAKRYSITNKADPLMKVIKDEDSDLQYLRYRSATKATGSCHVSSRNRTQAAVNRRLSRHNDGAGSRDDDVFRRDSTSSTAAKTMRGATSLCRRFCSSTVL